MGYRSEVAVRVIGDAKKVAALRDTMLLKYRDSEGDLWLTQGLFNEGGDNPCAEHRVNTDGTEEYLSEFNDIKWYTDCQNWYDTLKQLAESVGVAVEFIRAGEESGDVEHDYSDNIDDYGGTILSTSTKIEIFRVVN
jgi:hypothetical protein